MSLMCLFPWLDYGIDIMDFENFDFFVGQPIFTSLRADPAGQNVLSCTPRLLIIPPSIRKILHIRKKGEKNVKVQKNDKVDKEREKWVDQPKNQNFQSPPYRYHNPTTGKDTSNSC